MCRQPAMRAPLSGFVRAVLLAQRHQAGHLVLGDARSPCGPSRRGSRSATLKFVSHGRLRLRSVVRLRAASRVQRGAPKAPARCRCASGPSPQHAAGNRSDLRRRRARPRARSRSSSSGVEAEPEVGLLLAHRLVVVGARSRGRPPRRPGARSARELRDRVDGTRRVVEHARREHRRRRSRAPRPRSRSSGASSSPRSSSTLRVAARLGARAARARAAPARGRRRSRARTAARAPRAAGPRRCRRRPRAARRGSSGASAARYARELVGPLRLGSRSSGARAKNSRAAASRRATTSRDALERCRPPRTARGPRASASATTGSAARRLGSRTSTRVPCRRSSSKPGLRSGARCRETFGWLSPSSSASSPIASSSSAGQREQAQAHGLRQNPVQLPAVICARQIPAPGLYIRSSH